MGRRIAGRGGATRLVFTRRAIEAFERENASSLGQASGFTRLGARWYGFAPVKLPKGMRFADMFHGHNERIPIAGLHWGTDLLYSVVTEFGSGKPDESR